MSQSHGTAPFVPLADLSSKDDMDALFKGSVLLEDRLRDTKKLAWPIRKPWLDEKSGGDRDEGYYGFKRCPRRPYREQILEANNDTRLQSVVREVADRYIKSPGKGSNSNGKRTRD